MAPLYLSGWQPTQVMSVLRQLGTSTKPLLVVTDVGNAYAKPLGNPEGPHALLCDLVGTFLARWLGLPVFDHAVLELTDELLSHDPDLVVTAGPSLLAREVKGSTWSGVAKDLIGLANPEDVAGLVVLDTWLRNSDRYLDVQGKIRRNLRNVFLAEGQGRPVLYAIDHTHCFRGEMMLTHRVDQIDRVKDERLYGMFPEFTGLVTRRALERFRAKLETYSPLVLEHLLRSIPAAWSLDSKTSAALGNAVGLRARFLLDHLPAMLDGEMDRLGHQQLTGTQR